MSDPPVYADLLQELREFPPPEEFVRSAVPNDEAIYKRARDDYEAFWEEQALGLEWFEPLGGAGFRTGVVRAVEHGDDMDPAPRAMVRWGPDQHRT
jgi:hypothetical protein